MHKQAISQTEDRVHPKVRGVYRTTAQLLMQHADRDHWGNGTREQALGYLAHLFSGNRRPYKHRLRGRPLQLTRECYVKAVVESGITAEVKPESWFSLMKERLFSDSPRYIGPIATPKTMYLTSGGELKPITR